LVYKMRLDKTPHSKNKAGTRESFEKGSEEGHALGRPVDGSGSGIETGKTNDGFRDDQV
jgi:hypothetical protein